MVKSQLACRFFILKLKFPCLINFAAYTWRSETKKNVSESHPTKMEGISRRVSLHEPRRAQKKSCRVSFLLPFLPWLSSRFYWIGVLKRVAHVRPKKDISWLSSCTYTRRHHAKCCFCLGSWRDVCFLLTHQSNRWTPRDRCGHTPRVRFKHNGAYFDINSVRGRVISEV